MSDTVNAWTHESPCPRQAPGWQSIAEWVYVWGILEKGAYCVRPEIKCSSKVGKGSTLGTEQRAWAEAVTRVSQWAWTLDPVHQHLLLTSQQE